MRRVLATVAAAGLLLVLGAPQTSAQENPNYAGSRIDTPASLATSSPSIEALIVRKYSRNQSDLVVRTYLTTPSGLPDGCPAAGEHALETYLGDEPGQANTARSKAAAGTPCNGTYGIRITAKLNGKGLIPVSDSGITLNGEVKIVAPPGNVDPGSGSIEGGGVVLSWPALSPAPPDLTGYRVYRIDGDDATKLGEVGRNERTYTDSIPPAGGGKVIYQVKAVRAAPGQDVESIGGGKIVVDGVPVGSTTSTTTDTGGGGTGGTGGGTAGGTGGGTGGTDGGSTSTTKPGKTKTGGGRTFKPLGRGQVGVGTKAPRLGIPSGSNFPDLQSEDNGFDEELDYGDRLASGEDGLSSIDYEDGSTGKGMAVPVATGFVFAAWAFHLRYLARAAKPVKAAPRYSRR